MTVRDIIDCTAFKAVNLSEPEREIGGVYIGDLLSWVMGRAKENDAWITIMSNINVAAVASLADVACVVLAENVSLEEDVIKVVREKEINVISSSLPAYETAIEIYKKL